MFLSYCLKYAGIPQSAIPQEASVLALRSSMSDMDWLLDNEDGSAADVGDIVIYNKYVTRTVAVGQQRRRCSGRSGRPVQHGR